MAWISYPTGTSNALFGAWAASTRDVWSVGNDQTIVYWNNVTETWGTENSQPAQTFNAIHCQPVNNIPWQVGSSGTLERWNGCMWVRYSPSPVPLITLRGVFALASNDVWAVGDSGTIIHYNGTTWSTVASGTVRALNGVWGASSNDVWVAGDFGTLLHWNGSAWSVSANASGPFPTGTNQDLKAVSGFSASDVHVVGGFGTVLHFNGTAWSSQASGTSNTLRAVWRQSVSFAWAVGVSGTIIKYTAGTWATQTSGTTNQLNGVYGFSATDIWVVGSSKTLHSSDGTAWTAIDTNTANAVWGNATNDIWRVGSTSTSLNQLAHYDGSTWFIGQNLLTAVWGFSPTDIWAFGYNLRAFHFDGFVWRTGVILTGGWKYNVQALWGSGPNDLWAGAGGGGAGTGKLLHYDGVSWTLNTTLGGGDDVFTMFGFASNDIWVGGNGANLNHWDGATWTPFAKPVGATIEGIWGASPNDVWAFGTGGHIFHWDGISWSNHASPTVGTLGSAWGFAADDIYAVGGSVSGALVHWDGASWSNIATGSSQNFHAVVGESSADVWALGNNGAAFRQRRRYIQRDPFFGKKRIVYPFQWGISMALPKAIYGGGQGQLGDGRFVLFGGIDYTDFQNSVVNDTFVIAADGLSYVAAAPVPFSVGDVRSATLGDGRMLIVQSGTGDTATFNGTTWTVQPSTSLLGSGNTLVTLPNGNALLLGGQSNGVQEYNALSNSWSNRASSQQPHAGGSATVLPLLNQVFYASREGTSFNNGIPELYDITLDAWSVPINSPQAGNFCQTQVLLPNGKLFTCTSNFGFTLIADLYDPVEQYFAPLPSLPFSAHSEVSTAYPPNGFYVGERLIAVLSPGSPPRVAWFDYSLEQWFGGGFDSNPDYTTSGESLDGPTNIFYLGQPGATLGFLLAGFGTQNFGYFTPHAGGFYIERSQAPVNDGRVPTFNGTIQVVQGLTTDRAFITWNAGSDALTNFRDLNYYACAVQVPGTEDWNFPNNSTEIWAGSLSVEVRNLTPDTLTYFQVAVRNMLGKNQPGTSGFQDLSPEVTFTPTALLPPLGQAGPWTNTASLSEPRSGPAGAYLSEGRYLVWGGTLGSGAGDIPVIAGDIYSQRGLENLPEQNAPIFAEGAVIDASPREYGSPTTIDGEHHAMATGGRDVLGNLVADTHKYFPYTDSWGSLEGGTFPGSMNESVYRHAMVPFPYGSALRMGGMTVPGDVSSTTNTAELFTFGVATVRYPSPAPSPFTVGAIVVGVETGARGKITALRSGGFFDFIDFQPYNDIKFVSGEVVIDTAGGRVSALGSFISSYQQSWQFVAPMNQVRAQHSAIALNGYLFRLSNILSPFSPGEVVTGTFHGGTATVASYAHFGTNGIIEVTNISGIHDFDFDFHLTGSMGGEADAVFVVYRSTRVLVVGGKDETGAPVLSAEVYDGTSDVWNGPYATSGAHYLGPTIMQDNGKPLAIAGGSAVVEVFDQDLGLFNSVAPLPASKTEHTAHAFRTGNVGVFGGRSQGASGDMELWDVWAAGPTDIWAVGGTGPGSNYIWHSGGASGDWTRVQDTTSATLRSIYGFSSSDIWAVGDGGASWHYDGVSWTSISTGQSNALYCVFGVAGAELFATGASGTILSWTGAAWSPQTSGTAEFLYDMEGIHVGETINYIACGTNGTLVQSTNGTTWTVLPQTNPVANWQSILRVSSPSFAIWVVGDSGKMIRSTGGAFTEFVTGLPNANQRVWYSIRGLTSDNIYACGNENASSGDNAWAHFNGSSWSVGVPDLQDASPFAGMQGLWPIATNDVYMVSNTVWHWNGSIWSQVGTPGEAFGVVDTVLRYDPNTDAWSFLTSMNQARARHVSFLMPNNRVLVAGGEDNAGNGLDSAEISPYPG